MKKIITIMLAVMLIAAMSVPVSAVTPELDVPDMPDVSKIKFDFKIELPDDFWTRWFEEHPITVPTFNLPSDELQDRLGHLFGD